MYPGGKDTPGVWQRIVNQIPPHDVWVSAFAGDCAVTRHLKPAPVSILIDRDGEVLRRWNERLRPGQCLIYDDAVSWLRFAFALNVFRPPTPNCAAAAAVAENGGGGHLVRWEPGAVALFRGLVPESFWTAAGATGSRVASSCDGRSTPRVFVYADPPYVGSTRRKAKMYRHEMTDQQHAEFLAVAKQLPCPVLIHGYPSPLYEGELQGWRTFTFRAMTRRGLATEQVWCNYPAPEILHDHRQVGANKRQRERIRRRCRNWRAGLARAGTLERAAILETIADLFILQDGPEINATLDPAAGDGG